MNKDYRPINEIPFEVTEFHNPEQHVYAFQMDTERNAPAGMRVMKVMITSIELVSGDGQRTEELISEGLRFCVYRAGKGRVDYANEINGRAASLAMSADFTNPPQLRFTMALFSQPTDIGSFRLHKVSGCLTFTMSESDDV